MNDHAALSGSDSVATQAHLAAKSGEPRRLLTVDRGNSTFDCLDHDRAVRCRFGVDPAGQAAVVHFVMAARPVLCVAATVVRDGLRPILEALEKARCPVLRAGSDLACPLVVDYEPATDLGVDRWLGALAAYRRFGRAIVVDCGSATTVNLVDGAGVFRGGVIAPGLRAFVAGMNLVTPALPSPRFDVMPSSLPRSSQAAVDAGVLLGYCGMVERLVANAHRALGSPAQVVLTGGHAPLVQRHGRLEGELVDDLVHQGLTILAGTSA